LYSRETGKDLVDDDGNTLYKEDSGCAEGFVCNEIDLPSDEKKAMRLKACYNQVSDFEKYDKCVPKDKCGTW